MMSTPAPPQIALTDPEPVLVNPDIKFCGECGIIRGWDCSAPTESAWDLKC